MASISPTCLRCPEDLSTLRPASQELLNELNARIMAGEVLNRGGRRIEQPLAGGLVRQTGDLLYPIVDEIPVMLVEEAIALEEFAHAQVPRPAAEDEGN